MRDQREGVPTGYTIGCAAAQTTSPWTPGAARHRYPDLADRPSPGPRDVPDTS